MRIIGLLSLFHCEAPVTKEEISTKELLATGAVKELLEVGAIGTGVDTGGVRKIAGTLGADLLSGAGVVIAGTFPAAAGDGCLLECCRAGAIVAP